MYKLIMVGYNSDTGNNYFNTRDYIVGQGPKYQMF